jgi:ribosome-associated translation inhibitor RaiA
MNISITAQGFDLNTAIDRFVRDALQTGLQHFIEDIISVDVYLKDTNGPKGGIDKQVLLKFQLRSRQQLALTTSRENLYGAIKVSVQRAKRAIRRSLHKARRVERQSLRGLAADPAISRMPWP